MEVIPFYPNAGWRPPVACATGNDVTGRRRNMVFGEQLDHSMAISVANRVGAIDNDRARILRVFKPIKDCAALTHNEYIGAAGIELGVSGNKLNAEPPCR